MKTTKLACLAAVCLFCCGIAAADSTTDPMLELGGLPPGDQITFTATSFTFYVDFGSTGSADVTFQNLTGNTLANFDVDYSAGGLTCGTGAFDTYFATCDTTGTVVLFYGLNATEGFTGVPPATCVPAEEEEPCTGGMFEITFSGFPAGEVMFSGSDAAVPEPASLALILGGIGGLLTRKKLFPRK
jgi:hypothetical protein